MSIILAHLGPAGTYAEAAAIAYANWLWQHQHQEATLQAHLTIPQALHAAAEGKAKFAVVPVENSIEGTVTTTLDTLWQVQVLQVQQALMLPIQHGLLSRASALDQIQRVYSHPQALGQCQQWLELLLPNVQRIPTHSTAEATQYVSQDTSAGAIASQRAAELYNLPMLAFPINDYTSNCTQFWIVGLPSDSGGSHTSIAFSLPVNAPGSLVKPLQIFARAEINLSRIQSRPTKQEMGAYIFFIDLEADRREEPLKTALAEVQTYTETFRLLGSYSILNCVEYPKEPD